MTFLRQQLTVSPAAISEIAEKTTGQRDNPFWSMARKMRLTASNYGVILRACRLKRYYLGIIIINFI